MPSVLPIVYLSARSAPARVDVSESLTNRRTLRIKRSTGKLSKRSGSFFSSYAVQHQQEQECQSWRDVSEPEDTTRPHMADPPGALELGLAVQVATVDQCADRREAAVPARPGSSPRRHRESVEPLTFRIGSLSVEICWQLTGSEREMLRRLIRRLGAFSRLKHCPVGRASAGRSDARRRWLRSRTFLQLTSPKNKEITAGQQHGTVVPRTTR